MRLPAEAWWPGYFHSAYPAGYQLKQGWLMLKGSYSNSHHFPTDINVPEAGLCLLFHGMVTFITAWKRAKLSPDYQ